MAASSSGKQVHMEDKSILPSHMGGGPCGLGDPLDKTLRKVEKEIVIPKLMKEKAKVLCHEEVKAFNECGKASGLLLPFKCRKENLAMQNCTLKWYNDPKFVEDVTNQFLDERADYRRTGIPKKSRHQGSATA